MIIVTLLLFLALGTPLAGCNFQRPPAQDGQNQQPDEPAPAEDPTIEQNSQLAALLPSREGYRWYYNGFAEYGHRMTLKTIDKQNSDLVYSIEGEVDDPSGGEAKDRDFNLQIVYTIANGVLTQTKQEDAMLDSNYDRLDLIKTPLGKGIRWTQKVIDQDNIETDLECTIEDVKNLDGVAVYTVVYKDKNSDYYERREIKEGVGLVSFEKLLILQDQSFPAGYYLNEEASGY
ncbi:MAG TPA: hypothetical protein DEF34_12865 [Desulfotomaculum sp.]|nr:MAG: hypothetical protein JL56_06790 [Desulfotomaculum sp. BICA1-6]HBX24502.1 hypothetical protein [Desulfotomaculum sp.]